MMPKAIRGGAMTLQDIEKNEIYWPGMAGEVMKWCATCDICQKMRSGNKENAPDEPTSQASDGLTSLLAKLRWSRSTTNMLVDNRHVHPLGSNHDPRRQVRHGRIQGTM
jgi:hypothetical protein